MLIIWKTSTTSLKATKRTTSSFKETSQDVLCINPLSKWTSTSKWVASYCKKRKSFSLFVVLTIISRYQTNANCNIILFALYSTYQTSRELKVSQRIKKWRKSKYRRICNKAEYRCSIWFCDCLKLDCREEKEKIKPIIMRDSWPCYWTVCSSTSALTLTI